MVSSTQAFESNCDLVILVPCFSGVPSLFSLGKLIDVTNQILSRLLCGGYI